MQNQCNASNMVTFTISGTCKCTSPFCALLWSYKDQEKLKSNSRFNFELSSPSQKSHSTSILCNGARKSRIEGPLYIFNTINTVWMECKWVCCRCAFLRRKGARPQVDSNQKDFKQNKWLDVIKVMQRSRAWKQLMLN